MASSMMESLMCVCGSPGAKASSGGPGREMSRSEATLGGERSESPPPVAPGDGGGRPFCGKSNTELLKGLLYQKQMTFVIM